MPDTLQDLFPVHVWNMCEMCVNVDAELSDVVHVLGYIPCDVVYLA